VYLAIFHGHVDIVEILIKYQADLNHKTPNGVTPLIIGMIVFRVLRIQQLVVCSYAKRRFGVDKDNDRKRG
jgi:hypothetical protein